MANDPRKQGSERVVATRRALPTDRIRLEKQLEVIRATAAVSGPDCRVVDPKQLSQVLKLAESTVTLVAPFMVSIGVLERVGNQLTPGPEAFEYKRAVDLGVANPAARLAPAFRRAWFFEAIRPQLEFGPMNAVDAVLNIATAGNAQTSDTDRIWMLIDLLAAVGLIERNGVAISLARSDATAIAPPTPNEILIRPGPAAVSATVPPAVAVGPGAISFSVSVDVPMSEIATWDAARISAFMQGVAAILQAQKGTTP